jgi:hypothetical protein
MAHKAYMQNIATVLNFTQLPYKEQVRGNIIHLLIDRRDFDGLGGSMDHHDLGILLKVLPDHEAFTGWKLIRTTDTTYLLENSVHKYPAKDLGDMMAAVVDATHMTPEAV